MTQLPGLWLTEAEVVAVLDMSSAIEALELGLRQQAAGDFQNLAKTYLRWDQGHDLHALGAACGSVGLVGTKVWARTPKGANPLLVLFDSSNGSLRAVIEAFALGQFRTSAIAGLATRALARPGASTMAICGTGKQALPQVAAAAAVRDLAQVMVYGRGRDGRERLVDKIESTLGVHATSCERVEDAVAEADLVTLMTRAEDPFLLATMVRPGAHVNALGAIARDRMEFEPALLARCDTIAVDDLAAVRDLSRELIEFFGDGGWDRVVMLGEILAAGHPRSTEADLTLFKAMGMGISDVALGSYCLAAAMREGLGRLLAPVEKIALPLGGRAAE